jgi:hypothetical protein
MNAHRIRTLALPALLLVAAAGCDDNDITMNSAMLTSSEVMLTFETLDPSFGQGLWQTVTVRNSGGTSADLEGVTIEGEAADDFLLFDDSGMRSLPAGASLDIRVAFDPIASGERTAEVRILLGNGDDLIVPVRGRGQSGGYMQVDRMGIPALNTVFNHPPQFSKTDYNVATPDADVATYTGLFETVLGAVANPNPSGTAALLLPDALPVSLAGPTSFGTLTGRRLSDDAVDVALSVTVGIEALKSDNVDANDKAFSATFPYLAAPHR